MNDVLEISQTISLSPNHEKCFAFSYPSTDKKQFFAFGCDSSVYIYDRFDFKYRILSMPDLTSIIKNITFVDTKYLLCLNENHNIFVFLINSLFTEPFNIYNCVSSLKCIHLFHMDFLPDNLTASANDIIFINSQNKELYWNSFNDFLNNKHPNILAKLEYDSEISISPSGRAFAVFAHDSSFLNIWFAPFQKKVNTKIRLGSPLIDFKWGISSTLLCATATKDGVIRVWTESTDNFQMHQISWFNFDHEILYFSFCFQDYYDLHDTQSNHQAQSENSLVFPNCENHSFHIIVGIKETDFKQYQIKHFLLKHMFKPRLFELSSFFIPFYGNSRKFAKLNDIYRIHGNSSINFHYYQNRMVSEFNITLFSLETLKFARVAIDEKNTYVTVPYQKTFMRSHPESFIVDNSKQIIAKMANNTIFNFNTCDVLSFTNNNFHFVYENKEIFLEKNHIIYQENKNTKVKNKIDFEIDFEPKFCKFHFLNDVIIIGLVADNAQQKIVIFNEKFFIMNISYGCDYNEIIDVEFHSTDIFAIIYQYAICIYFYQNNQYLLLGKVDHISCKSFLFLPRAKFAIYNLSSSCLEIYDIQSNGFDKIYSATYVPIVALNYLNKSFIAATSHHIFSVYIKDFQNIKNNDLEYRFTLALTLCQYSYVQNFLNGNFESDNSISFSFNDESFEFPKFFDSNIPSMVSYFNDFLNSLPNHWNTVDLFGQRFLIGFVLTKICNKYSKYSSLFSIWGLLSKEQNRLLEIVNTISLSNIYPNQKKDSFSSSFLSDTLIHFWVKDDKILKYFLINYLSQHLPYLHEVDDYILLCVIFKKFSLASKAAKFNGNEKLSEFLSMYPSKETKSVTIEHSAFEALKQHRFSLAAMFFYIINKNSQAITSLKSKKTFMILVARLIQLENWYEFIEDPFYLWWWKGEKEKAFHELSLLYYENNNEKELVSSHKLEILKNSQFSTNYMKFIFDIQNYPFIVKSLLNTNPIYSLSIPNNSNTYENITEKPSNEIIDHNTTKSTKFTIDENEFESKNFVNFSFGGGWDDIIYEEEEDDIENNQKSCLETTGQTLDQPPLQLNNIIYMPFKSNLIDLFTSDTFESTHTEPISSENEENIISLLALLYNRAFSPETIRHLLIIAKKLISYPQMLHLITILVFSITYSLSELTWMAPLFQKNFDPFYLINVIDHFNSIKLEDYNFFQSTNQEIPIPDFSHHLRHGLKLPKNDKKILCFVAFHQMLDTLCELIPNKNISKNLNLKYDKSNNQDCIKNSFIIDFLYHRYQIMLESIENFSFSDISIINDLFSLGINCKAENLSKFSNKKENEKLQLSFLDEYQSPFFIDSNFNSTTSFELHTNFSIIYDICISSINNNKIAFASNQLHIMNINNQAIEYSSSIDDLESIDSKPENLSISPTQNNNSKPKFNIEQMHTNISKSRSIPSMKSLSINEVFHSPLHKFLKPQKIFKEIHNINMHIPLSPSIQEKSFKKRNIASNANQISNNVNTRNVKAIAVDSHPRYDIFVSGDDSGTIHFWNFKDRSKSLGQIQLTQNPIPSLHFNEKGDRIACLSSCGELLISDLDKKQYTFSLDQVPAHLYSNKLSLFSFVWLNSDTQILLSDGFNRSLYIYDILASNKPVATFNLYKKIKIAEEDLINRTLNINYDLPLIPISLSNEIVSCGFYNGDVILYDIRASMRFAKFPIYQDQVTAIKFDHSGRFFITGCVDNTLCVVNSQTFENHCIYQPTLNNENISYNKSGITSIALTKHTIVASGYSSYIHTWTKDIYEI